MREYRPIAVPFEERGLAKPPTLVLFGRRIVRSDSNAQKSMTAREETDADRMSQKRAKPEAAYREHELPLSAP
jgi:hypothetical protein